jgi:hypothetical protein
MNLGTTGTYINLTNSVLSGTTHSVTIGTRGDVQIFEVCYFRIAYDRTAITQYYYSYLDSFYYEGANSTQYPTITTVNASSFKYRNYLMGFNQIIIPSATTQVTDIWLQIINDPRTFWTFSLATSGGTNTTTPTYEYLLANVFHHRRPVCLTNQYFSYQD